MNVNGVFAIAVLASGLGSAVQAIQSARRRRASSAVMALSFAVGSILLAVHFCLQAGWYRAGGLGAVVDSVIMIVWAVVALVSFFVWRLTGKYRR